MRATAEGSAALAKGLVTFALLVWFNCGVVSFGLAQVAYGLTVAVTYLGYFYRTIRKEGHACGYRSLSELLPRRLIDTGAGTDASAGSSGASWLEPSALALAVTFAGQSVFKHLLTEGDKIVLSFGSSLHDQVILAYKFYISRVLLPLLRRRLLPIRVRK